MREYGSTLYVEMAWKKMAAHTFQLQAMSLNLIKTSLHKHIAFDI